MPDIPGIEDELFMDDFGTFWLPKADRTRNEARRAIELLDGCPYIELGCRTVRGSVGTRHGEPWFTVDPEAPDEWWEVYYR